MSDMVHVSPEFHTETIKCLKCGKIQEAKVLHTYPWFSYVHECECGEIILESEWTKVKEAKN